MSDADEVHSQIEVIKLLFDYLKHLTTLCTGSILLLVTFLERLFKNPEWKLLVAFSYLGFVLSILAALVAMIVLAACAKMAHEPTPTERRFFTVGTLTSLTSFFFAILCLVSFAIKNLT